MSDLAAGPDPLEDDQHLFVAADHLAEALDRWGLVLGGDVGPPLEKRADQTADVLALLLGEHVAGRVAGQPADQPEVGQLVDAVIHVHPHAAEDRHQRIDVKGFVGTRVQESKAAQRAAAIAQACETVPRHRWSVARGAPARSRVERSLGVRL
jgi:hypothetical protein